MTSSSPYAAFRAEEWMRASMIRPRKAFPPTSHARSVVERHHASVSSAEGSMNRPSVVQGELFLFPVILGC